MSVLPFLLEKEFRQIFRDRTILAMMLVVPVVQLTILPLAADFEVSSVNVALVDQDHSPYSRELMNKVASSGYFRVAGDAVSYPQALGLVEDGKADLVLQIPAGFERNLVREGRQEVGMAVDAINGNDFATLRTMVYLGALLFILFQILTDISYVLVDPRIRLQ